MTDGLVRKTFHPMLSSRGKLSGKANKEMFAFFDTKNDRFQEVAKVNLKSCFNFFGKKSSKRPIFPGVVVHRLSISHFPASLSFSP